jgi:hypothetical protein
VRKVGLEDVLDLVQYEKVRDERRRAIIALKQHRRVGLGPDLTLLFENRETVLFQVQEMIRAERIVQSARLQEEIDAYNALVPEPGQLSATLFIELPALVHMTQAEVHRAVNRFQGLERALTLHVGAQALPAVFEAGHSTEEKMAAVHYVRFEVPQAARDALAAGAAARLVVAHSDYAAESLLSAATLQELRRDLAS